VQPLPGHKPNIFLNFISINLPVNEKRTVFQLIVPEVEAFAVFLNSTNFPI